MPQREISGSLSHGIDATPTVASRLFILREVVFRSIQRFAFTLLPSPIRIQGLSFFRNYLLDLRDRIKGESDPDTPPRHLNISGAGPFRTFGCNTVDLCREHGTLAQDDVVLDIGCGIGRTALALGDYLTTGEYYGFDVIGFAVKWCRKHIGTRHSNFHFAHADIFNLTYNPRGRVPAEKFMFPYADGAMSFALATSLFTHVMPAAAEHYIAQTSRVLKSGGRFLSTWFLLDDEVERALSEGRTSIQFPHRFARHAQTSLHAPEQAVAFPRSLVVSAFERNGFVLERVFRGDWTGTGDNIDSMQDVIVARRL
jgi:SAM-dependent methyltransferase